MLERVLYYIENEFDKKQTVSMASKSLRLWATKPIRLAGFLRSTS
jgi:hypothetical protein